MNIIYCEKMVIYATWGYLLISKKTFKNRMTKHKQMQRLLKLWHKNLEA